jgi:DNA-binding beta-propeller fold protein YncE
MLSRRVLRGTAALALLLAPAGAQGRFANFETPQTHPIDIATVNGVDYVLVCNTPDNSVDIFTAAAPHTFVQRVPVGMGPGTVRWNAAQGRFYTCNFDGDSVSVVQLNPSGSSVLATLERTSTMLIGDEPADIAFDSNGVAVVSLSSRSSVSFVGASDLSFAGGTSRLTAIDPVSNNAFAVKMPRQIAWLPDGRFFAANFRGGSPDAAGPAPQYDLGIYRKDPLLSGGLPDFVGGLGTTNHAFAIHAEGNLMFVVGTKAKNHATNGVQAVSQLKTGFVQSWLMVVDIPPGGTMVVHPEAPAATVPAPLFPSINLNRDYTSVPLAELPTAQALVQPTDVLLIEDSDGGIRNVVLSAFHSDRVAILTPTTATAGGYTIQRVNIPVLNPGSSYAASGPRGLAFSALNQLVYVCDRLDNTLSVVDPNAGTLTAQIQLPNDPTPSDIRFGRQFLYSNRFSIDSSGGSPVGGFVSCAACHVDGRTDGLPWDLGDVAIGPGVQPEFHDENGFKFTTMPNFPSEKGPMVTQTLQGLVNYELNEIFQFASTNAPYHWRGDKKDFTDFNEAFVNLQRMQNVGTAGAPRGLSVNDMIAYRRFVNTILHPPNPEQDLTRVTPGTLDADHPNDPLLATGAQLGMMVFHDFAVVGHRSCVDCHHLPDGSSNTSTLNFPVPMTISGGTPQLHPLESAALRNIAQREMVLHPDFGLVIDQQTANSGLLHPGDRAFLTSLSINQFINNFFPFMPGPGASDRKTQVEAVTEFVRQLDTGTAPLAGFAYTVDPNISPINSGLNLTAFDIGEAQVAQANIGLGVYTRNGPNIKGYWYDTTVSPAGYREEGTSNVISRGTLLNLALGAGNVVIAQGTPLGTERRWSNPSGIATPIVDLANVPANLTLEKMAPNTAFVGITSFNGNLNLTAPSNSSIWTLRKLQTSVAGFFGVPTSLRHEPPRRFRVTGDSIRPGAKLYLAMASGTSPASFPVEIMIMDLYPTKYTSGGRQIWETLVELDATQTFALLNGGYLAPDVAAVLLRTNLGPGLSPSTWNKYLVAILNEDGTFGFNASNWQALWIQDNR